MENELPSVTIRPGRPARLHEMSGPMSPDTPNARTAWQNVVTASGVSSSRNTMSTDPTAKSAPDASVTGCLLYHSRCV